MIIGLMMAKNRSSRFTNKNLFDFADGMTLFEWSLKENLKSKWYDMFFVISDCPEVERICEMYPEVKFIKESEQLAKLNDSWQVIRFFLDKI